MKLRPLDNKVIVEVEEANNRTKGGLYIPDASIEDKSEGKIISLGPRRDELNNLKVGDRVIFGKYAGDEIVIAEKKLKILKENEILCVICD